MKLVAILAFLPAMAAACSISLVEDYSRLEMRPDFAVTITHLGKPLTGAKVEIVRVEEKPRLTKTTASDGTVEITGLPPGNYILSASYMDRAAVWGEQFHVSRRPTSKAQSRRAYAWGDDAEIVGALAGAYLIRTYNPSDVAGQFKWGPIPLAHLAYENVLTHEQHSLGPSKDGTFDFGPVPPGTYLLRAETQIVNASDKVLLVVTPESPRTTFTVKIDGGACESVVE